MKINITKLKKAKFLFSWQEFKKAWGFKTLGGAVFSVLGAMLTGIVLLIALPITICFFAYAILSCIELGE